MHSGHRKWQAEKRKTSDRASIATLCIFIFVFTVAD